MKTRSTRIAWFAAIFLSCVAVGSFWQAAQAQEPSAPDSVWQTILEARDDVGADQPAPPECPAPSLIEQAFVQAVQAECLEPYLQKEDGAGLLKSCIGKAPTVENVLTGGYLCHQQANNLRIAAFEIRKARLDQELSGKELQLSENEEAALRATGDGQILAWSSLAACAVRQAAQIANADKRRADQWQDFLSKNLAVQNSEDVWAHAEVLIPMAAGLFQRGVAPFAIEPQSMVRDNGKVDWSPLHAISQRRVTSKTGASFTAQDLKRIAHLAQQGKGLVDQRNQCLYDEATAGLDDFVSKADVVLAEVTAELRDAEKALYCTAQTYDLTSRTEEHQAAFWDGAYRFEAAPGGAVAVLPLANWQRLLRVKAQLAVVSNGVRQDLSADAIAAHQEGLENSLANVDVILSAALEETRLCSTKAQGQRVAHLKAAQELMDDVACPRSEAVRLKQAQIENLMSVAQPEACSSNQGNGAFVHLRAKGRGLIFAADGTSEVWEGHETVVAHTAKNDDAASFKRWALQQISLSSVCGHTDRPTPHAPDLWLQAPEVTIAAGPFVSQEEAEAALPDSEWRLTGEAGQTVSQLQQQELCRPQF